MQTAYINSRDECLDIELRAGESFCRLLHRNFTVPKTLRNEPNLGTDSGFRRSKVMTPSQRRRSSPANPRRQATVYDAVAGETTLSELHFLI